MKSVIWWCVNCLTLPGLLSIQQSKGLLEAVDMHLGEEDLCWDLLISLGCASQFAARGLRDIYLNDSHRQLLGKVSLSLSSLGIFPADTVLANLKTSARLE